MVGVPVGDHGEVEPPQVDAEPTDVPREDVAVVSGVEEDSAAAVLDERREPPVALEARSIAEGVVQDRHPCGVGGGGHRGPSDRGTHRLRTTASRTAECGITIPPST